MIILKKEISRKKLTKTSRCCIGYYRDLNAILAGKSSLKLNASGSIWFYHRGMAKHFYYLVFSRESIMKKTALKKVIQIELRRSYLSS